MNDLTINYIGLDKLIPYVNNSRTHDEAQVAQIAASIKEFGFTNPILIDDEGSIIAGHGRVMAARKLSLKSVPTITLSGLSDIQKRAYIIADNKLALNAGWDNDLLMLELDTLSDAGYDLDLTGFSADEINDLISDEVEEEEKYTSKTDVFDYEPSGEKPELVSLFNDTKTNELLEEINSSNLDEEEKAFLRLAAYRHVVLDFEKIANYYAQSESKVQSLIEKSALVIIDYNNAIAGGFAVLTKELQEIEQGNE